jgi:hypothetical protein
VAVFAHELGHTLGLGHDGHAAWGAFNCKPNYDSVMNYAYQNDLQVGFSRGVGEPLRTRSVHEAVPVDARMAALLRAPPFELDVDAEGVDWNRDGLVADRPVRAALTWATYKSCSAMGVGRRTLAAQAAPASPAWAARGERLFALWITPEPELGLAYSAADAVLDFSEPRSVVGVSGLRHIAISADAAQPIALALVTADEQLAVAELLPGDAALEASSPRAIPGARTTQAPAVVWMDVGEPFYGANRALGVFFVAPGEPAGALMQASAASPAGPFFVRPVLDTALRPITSTQGPSLLSLGTGELCGAFPDAEGYIRFYCYDASRDLWNDRSAQAFYATLGPQTGSPVELGYHRYRAADGSLLGGAQRGAVYLSFTEPASGTSGPPDNPNLLISQWLDVHEPARDAIDFRWRGSFIDQWTHLAPGTRVALHEDGSGAASVALMAVRAQDGARIDLLPHADGIFEGQLGDGNDFEVMERGICAELRGKSACGSPKTAAY